MANFTADDALRARFTPAMRARALHGLALGGALLALPGIVLAIAALRNIKD